MTINTDTNKLYNIIIDSLKNKKPFLITRIGDGEYLIHLNDMNNKLVAHMYNRHLGYIPEKHKTNEISSFIEETIYDSDVLSLQKTMDGIIWSDIPNLYQTLQKKNPTKWGDKFICDHNVHFHFMNGNLFDNLLKNTEHLSLITCRDVEDKIKNKYPNLKTITTYKIPGENMFEEDKKIKDYYPKIFNNIKNQILSKDHSGHLLLLGGGFVGKKLGYYFKQTGGVSFDIGSVFDFWVGKVTRGEGRGHNKYIKPLL